MKDLYVVYYVLIVFCLTPELEAHNHLPFLERTIAETKQFFTFFYWIICYVFFAEASVLTDKKGVTKELLRPFKIMIGYYVFRKIYLIIFC